MLCIVAHHYVVNSGITDAITQSNVMSFNSLFALLFGWGGKTGINCFVLITGYFMCKSSISLKKFLKILLELEFYKIVFYLIFLCTGYSDFSIKQLIKVLFPVYSIGRGFSSSYLILFLFIPYLNLLVDSMNKKQHPRLITLSLFVGTVLQTFMKATEAFTYVGWFMVLYFIAAYIRCYPSELFCNRKIWGYAAMISILLSWGTVVFGALVYNKTGIAFYYYFVSNSNKFFAVLTAICVFLFFKNLKLKYHPVINSVAASTFGVLLIHANSDLMRQWLWKDMLKNVVYYESNFFVFHAIGSVFAVYVICTLIDMLRIRFLEKPFFVFYDSIIYPRIEVAWKRITKF